MRTVAIVSGGLDSTVLAYHLKQHADLAYILSFQYGQRHGKELLAARRTAHALNVEQRIVDLRPVLQGLAGSALTDHTVAVPHGHYAHENMRITVVPNRNVLFLAAAYARAAADACDAVAIGVHAGDHTIYPDCRPAFLDAFYGMECQALADRHVPALYTPFVDRTKADIVKLGETLAVPFVDTWSCYLGGELHCGLCATCVERREAFLVAHVPDPTPYASPLAETIAVGQLTVE